MFSLRWTLFVIFEKITAESPWPHEIFLIKEFFHEYWAQHQVMEMNPRSCRMASRYGEPLEGDVIVDRPTRVVHVVRLAFECHHAEPE